MKDKKVYVFIDIRGKTHLVGQLWSRFSRGHESASFEYDAEWLKNKARFAIEPALSLYKGAFHTANNIKIFGSLGDSAPDRWGRMLIRRSNKNLPLNEIDYLLAVNDVARQGALRFKDDLNGDFLANNTVIGSIPPIVKLKELLSASNRFVEDKETQSDLRLLLAPGSSLGGARPKSCVCDHLGNLFIAKFPRKDDEFSVVLWEAVALTLARNAGITVPNWKLEYIDNTPVLIIERFDRKGLERRAFLSAMSMIGALDNEDNHSYLEIADALQMYGAHPNQDMKELWHRIIFSVLISNTDDHLRNHGFLYVADKGWTLSPVYDVNPTLLKSKVRSLSLNIDLHSNDASLELALSVLNEFRLSTSDAKEMIQKTVKSTSNWRKVAQSLSINSSEIEQMAPAFEHQESHDAMRKYFV